jgi:hypothetical protein
MTQREQFMIPMLYIAGKMIKFGAGIPPDDEYDECMTAQLLSRLDELYNLAHESAGTTSRTEDILEVFFNLAPSILSDDIEEWLMYGEEVALRYSTGICTAYIELEAYGY